MTQPTDITLANQSGANFRTELNSILQGFGSTQKGSSAPTYAVTGMHWIDDSSTPWIEKVYDGTDWISIYEINATTNTIRIINQADGTTRTGGANIGQIQDSAFTWLGTTSGTNTVTASLTPAITAYVTGGVYRFIVGTTNTGAVTLNVNSVGAKAVQFQGAALAANSFVAGDVITVVYDGTQFQVISPVGGTEGDILYYNASNQLTRLPKGTDDEVLTLASGLPSWEAAGGGGGWVPIQTQTVTSAVASVDFTTGIDGTYKSYAIVITGLNSVSNNVTLYIRTGNGGSFDSGASDYGYSTVRNFSNNASVSVANSTSSNVIDTQLSNSSNSEKSSGGVVIMQDPSNSSIQTIITYDLQCYPDNTDIACSKGAGVRKEAAAHDRIQFLFSSGNIASGTITLYGLAGA